MVIASTLLAAVLSVSPAAPSPQSEYAAAYQAAIRSGRPLVVLIGASWCGPCQQVKPLYPALRQRGAFVHLDMDRDLEAKDMDVAKLPTLIVFERRDGRFWPAKRFVGVDSITQFCKGVKQ